MSNEDKFRKQLDSVLGPAPKQYGTAKSVRTGIDKELNQGSK